MLNKLAKERVLSLTAEVLPAKSRYLLVEISDFKLEMGRAVGLVTVSMISISAPSKTSSTLNLHS